MTLSMNKIEQLALRAHQAKSPIAQAFITSIERIEPKKEATNVKLEELAREYKEFRAKNKTAPTPRELLEALQEIRVQSGLSLQHISKVFGVSATSIYTQLVRAKLVKTKKQKEREAKRNAKPTPVSRAVEPKPEPKPTGQVSLTLDGIPISCSIGDLKMLIAALKQ